MSKDVNMIKPVGKKRTNKEIARFVLNKYSYLSHGEEAKSRH